MTSVVTDQIYFNEDTDVTYTKTRTLSNGVYTVTLKHDYVSSFLVDSRILNECFNTFSFNDEDNAMNCENCPDMIIRGKGSGLLPCGRTRCKVETTAKERKEKEEHIYG